MQMQVVPLQQGPEPDLLDERGLMRLYPAAHLDRIAWPALRMWCHNHARYGLPTVELIAWLRDFIGDRKAIEIGAGAGDLAAHLWIPATDNRSQEWQMVREYYISTQQPLITYPEFVKDFDALDAIAHYKPAVVIGCWVTQWVDPLLPIPDGGGCMYGVKEDELLATGVQYVVIGNQAIHGKKLILSRPHQEFRLPFLRSRAADQSLNRIYVW